MSSKIYPVRIAAAAVTLTVVLGSQAPALAAGPNGQVSVSDQETIQAHLDASGKVKDASLYDQVALQGTGKVTIENPVSTKGLRNLDGFGGFTVKDGKIVQTVSVDGQRRLRSVSDFPKTLPLKVSVTYTLNGKQVKPGSVVGKSGNLDVHYRVENVTGVDQQLTYNDGTGKSVSKSASVAIPMVGTLSTLLPSSFTDVRSGEAAMAGDGFGGTQLNFTMTLFGPIGSTVAEFGYTAKIKDGQVPAATIQALPISPLDNYSFKDGAASYKAGADSGVQLTGGAVQIDDNVLKLRDGASTLVAGLLKLKAGADQLSSGLNKTAVPGAAKLATGAGQLKNGTSQLAAGSGTLAGGAESLASGSSDLAGGANSLADGIAQILDGVDTLPAALAQDASFKQLKGALLNIQKGVGSPSDTSTATLLGGLNLLKYGLRSPLGIAHCNPSATDATACGAADGVQLVQQALTAADPNLAALIVAAKGSYNYAVLTSVGTCPQLQNGLPQVTALAVPGSPCYAAASVLIGLAAPPGVYPAPFDTGGVQAQTAFAAATLTKIWQGLDSQAIPGINALKLGLSNPACNPSNPTNPANPCGIKEAAGLVSGGIDQLVNSIAAQLSTALQQATAGADQVAGGAGQVADGAGQVSTGANKVSSGANQLDSGARQVSDGAHQLASGLKDAGSGSSQLADGLKTAAGQAPALPNGASQLSAQGTSQLVASGKSTAADYGEKYALIQAGAQRAKTDGMAYGAPANASGATAYSMELAAATTQSRDNWLRGLGAVLIFVLAGVGGAFLRRRFAK
ncbi:MAG TPA: hypothetical protein VGH11_08915 [Jatrophihabitans sp.]